VARRPALGCPGGPGWATMTRARVIHVGSKIFMNAAGPPAPWPRPQHGAGVLPRLLSKTRGGGPAGSTQGGSGVTPPPKK